MQFKDIPGHTKVKQQLIHRVHNGQMPHAQLFVGPEGSGKLPLVLAYAQFINCLNPSEEDSCGTCNACRKSSKFIHPDIHYTFPTIVKKSGEKPVSTDYYTEWRAALAENIYMTEFEWLNTLGENKQGNITARECKELVRKTSLKAFEAKYKVFIIWKAEKLRKEGNRLLKTIEEPPPNTLLLLIANKEENILQTILSRTQSMRLNHFEDANIAHFLVENKGIEQQKAEEIAILTEGNMSLALQYSSQLGNNNSVHLQNWLNHCQRNDVIKINEWVNETATFSREAQKNFVLYCLHFFRQALLMKMNANNKTRLGKNEEILAQQIHQTMSFDNFEQISVTFNKSYKYLERNAHSKLLFFNLSLQLKKLLK